MHTTMKVCQKVLKGNENSLTSEENPILHELEHLQYKGLALVGLSF